MKSKESQNEPARELGHEEQEWIRDRFYAEVVPKLIRLNARLGTLSCAFAGPAYEHWMVRFRSRGDDFEIVEFEYDEQGDGIDLDI